MLITVTTKKLPRRNIFSVVCYACITYFTKFDSSTGMYFYIIKFSWNFLEKEKQKKAHEKRRNCRL